MCWRSQRSTWCKLKIVWSVFVRPVSQNLQKYYDVLFWCRHWNTLRDPSRSNWDLPSRSRICPKADTKEAMMRRKLSVVRGKLIKNKQMTFFQWQNVHLLSRMDVPQEVASASTLNTQWYEQRCKKWTSFIHLCGITGRNFILLSSGRTNESTCFMFQINLVRSDFQGMQFHRLICSLKSFRFRAKEEERKAIGEIRRTFREVAIDY